MTVEELINELMASCQSLDDDVMVGVDGGATLVSGHADSRTVWINDYPDGAPVEKGQ